MGSVPSASPTRNTASHSSPLAACSDARVTPCTTGGCRASARCTQLGEQGAQVQRRPLRHFLVDEFGQRGQRLPPLTGLGARRRLGGEPQRLEHRAHDRVRKRVGSLPPVDVAFGGALQRQQRLADLLAAEEALAAAHLERDTGLGERLFVDLSTAR